VDSIKAAMGRENQLLTISEVSNSLNISKHTLRFWEKEFMGLFAPRRTQGGQRRFSAADISRIEEIKKLRNQGMSLSEIRSRLSQDQKGDDPGVRRIDLLAQRVAEVVKAEVYDFLGGRIG
jgi:DNA-binding transcriptional MerR regulator